MFTAIWDFLNGNKTIFGALFLALASSGFIPEGVITDILNWLGLTLGAGGAAHKLVKGSAPRTAS